MTYRLTVATMSEPDAAAREAIVVYRQEGRMESYGHVIDADGAIPGGCSWMSEWVDGEYGYRQTGGCYLKDPYSMAGESGTEHIAHLWNILPDGRILDTTADQFFEGDVDGIRITAGDDPRYDPTCDGEACLEWFSAQVNMGVGRTPYSI